MISIPSASQRIRKTIEEGFGRIMTIAGQEPTRLKGRDRVGFVFTFAAAAYNLVRLSKPKATTASHGLQARRSPSPLSRTLCCQ